MRIIQHILRTHPYPRVWRQETEHASPHSDAPPEPPRHMASAGQAARPANGEDPDGSETPTHCRKKKTRGGPWPGLGGAHRALSRNPQRCHPGPYSSQSGNPGPGLSVCKAWKRGMCVRGGKRGNQEHGILVSVFFSVPGLNGEDLAVRDDRANCGAACLDQIRAWVHVGRIRPAGR